MEENITGTVGSLSLTRANGTVIPVKNLPEEIEVTFHAWDDRLMCMSFAE